MSFSIVETNGRNKLKRWINSWVIFHIFSINCKTLWKWFDYLNGIVDGCCYSRLFHHSSNNRRFDWKLDIRCINVKERRLKSIYVYACLLCLMSMHVCGYCVLKKWIEWRPHNNKRIFNKKICLWIIRNEYEQIVWTYKTSVHFVNNVYRKNQIWCRDVLI